MPYEGEQIKVIIVEYPGAKNYDWQARLHETYCGRVLDHPGMELLIGWKNTRSLMDTIERNNPAVNLLTKTKDNHYSLHIAVGTKKQFEILAEDALSQLRKWLSIPVDGKYFGSDSEKLLIWISILLQTQSLDLLQELFDEMVNDIRHPHYQENGTEVFYMVRYWLEQFDYAELGLD